MQQNSANLEYLCCWLIHNCEQKQNPIKAERCFEKYYESMSPSLLKYIQFIMKASSIHGNQSDDFLSMAFAKFIVYIRDKREDSAIKIKKLAPTLNLVDRGIEFDQQAKCWGNNMVSWVNDAINFCNQLEEHCVAGECEEKAIAINDRLGGLKEEGDKLLDWIGWKNNGESMKTESLDETEFENKSKRRNLIERRVRAVKKLITKNDYDIADNELGFAGSAGFVMDCDEIIRISNCVKIPLPELLFTIAKNVIRDSFRTKNDVKESSIDDPIFTKDSGMTLLDMLGKQNEKIKQKQDNLNSSIVYENKNTLEYAETLLNAPLKRALNNQAKITAAIDASDTQNQKTKLEKDLKTANQNVLNEQQRYKINKKVKKFLSVERSVTEIGENMGFNIDEARKYKTDVIELLSPLAPQEYRLKLIRKMLHYLNQTTYVIEDDLPELPNNLGDEKWIPVLLQIRRLLRLAIDHEKNQRQFSLYKQNHDKDLLLDLCLFNAEDFGQSELYLKKIETLLSSPSELTDQRFAKETDISMDTVKKITEDYYASNEVIIKSNNQMKALKKLLSNVEKTLDAFQNTIGDIQ